MDALGCENNQLSSLNVGECTFLTHLECYNNQLTTLDLSGCTALSGLVCYNNPLTKIILPRNHHISDFRIQEITEEYGDIIEYAE